MNAERHEQMGRQIAALGLVTYPNLGYDPADPTWNEAGYTIVGSDEATVCDLLALDQLKPTHTPANSTRQR